MHFIVKISLAFAYTLMILYIFGANAFYRNNFLSICLQSNDFVHIWCQTHLKVMISLAFAFKITIFYLFGLKYIFK